MRLCRRLTLISLVCLSAIAATAAAASDEASAIRFHGVKIKVADMQQALAFYRDVIGYRSQAIGPDLVRLLDPTTNLYLQQAGRTRAADAAASRTVTGFQANDLKEAMNRFKGQSRRLTFDPIRKNGVGIATTFRDPSGNLLYLLEQQVGSPSPFREPRVYNAGFQVNDAEAAKRFYSGILGFVSRSDRYFPAIPMGHGDGSFAFMLHESKQLTPAQVDYPRDTQVLVVFETKDLTAAAALLQSKGVEFLDTERRRTSIGRTMAFRDPFGIVSELLEAGQGN